MSFKSFSATQSTPRTNKTEEKEAATIIIAPTAGPDKKPAIGTFA